MPPFARFWADADVRVTIAIASFLVARGFLSGSAWKDYLATGEVCATRLPPGLRESDRLPRPIAFRSHREALRDLRRMDRPGTIRRNESR